MAQINWLGGNGTWTTDADWSSGQAPESTDDVFLSVSGGYTVSLTTPVTVASITISDGGATLAITDPGQVETVTGDFNNSGKLWVDNGGPGGSTLTIGGLIEYSGSDTWRPLYERRPNPSKSLQDRGVPTGPQSHSLKS